MEFSAVMLDGVSFSASFNAKEVTGNQILSRVFLHCGLEEDRKYFGLLRSDPLDGGMNWIDPTDLFKKGKRRIFQFGVRFYPKHPDTTLKEETARYLLRCQIKLDLLSAKLACSIDTHAFLDSLILQSELGDWKSQSSNSIDVLRFSDKVEIVTPSWLNARQIVSEVDYLKLVLRYYKQHRGACRADLDLMFLGQMRFVPWYGHVAYPLATGDGQSTFLSLSDSGICLLQAQYSGRMEPPSLLESFAWNALAYCEGNGNVLFVGIYRDNDQVAEYIYKVSKRRDAVKTNQASRIAKHVTAYQEILLSPQRAFYGSKKLARRRINSARLPKEQPSSGRLRRRLSSLTLSFRRRSVRKKLEVSPSNTTVTSTNLPS